MPPSSHARYRASLKYDEVDVLFCHSRTEQWAWTYAKVTEKGETTNKLLIVSSNETQWISIGSDNIAPRYWRTKVHGTTKPGKLCQYHTKFLALVHHFEYTALLRALEQYCLNIVIRAVFIKSYDLLWSLELVADRHPLMSVRDRCVSALVNDRDYEKRTFGRACTSR